MPFSSSRSEKNAARTTKVAPCNSCAGPNTAPRNEWAIMIWSETSTAYKRHLRSSRIADQRAARVRVDRKQRRQTLRQIGEFDWWRDERIERGIVEQRERRRHPLLIRPARPVGCSDLADLARDQPQAAAVERASERRGDVARAIPAQLDDRRLLAGDAQRGGEAGAAGAGMEHH